MDTKAVQYCQQLHVCIIRLTFLEILYWLELFPIHAESESTVC